MVGSPSPASNWIYKTSSGYRSGIDSYVGSETITSALFSYGSANPKELFSYDSSSGNAVFLGQYDSITTPDTIIFGGTGGVFSALGSPVKLTAGAPGVLAGSTKWASSSATASALITIASGKITVETGAFTDSSGYVLSANRKKVIIDNEDVYYSGAAYPYVLFSLSADGNLGYLGTTANTYAPPGVSAATPLVVGAVSASLGAFTGSGTPIVTASSTGFISVSDLTLPSIWQGSWRVTGSTASVDADGIVIGADIKIGSNDGVAVTNPFILGARNLRGTLYASLASAVTTANYGVVDFYVYDASLGLVYVGRGTYSDAGSVNTNDPDTLTFGAATTVIKTAPNNVFIKQ
jgi:hypothetical protein